MFLPGTNKRDLQRTLEHFDVNRVWTMTVSEFAERFTSGQPLPLCGVRSFTPSDTHYYHTANSEIYGRFLRGEIADAPHFICENMRTADDTALVCNGEAMLYWDEYRTWSWAGFVNYEKGLTCRMAGLSPNAIHIKTRLQVPKPIFNLVWEKGLINYVVEFSIYGVPVGIHQKGVLIWEIRKY